MEVIESQYLQHISGGEVGATGQGDDYHYTGEQSMEDCIADAISGDSVISKILDCVF